MDTPSVCCILLTRDRPEMARQAVEGFLRQTYPAHLVIWDSSKAYWDHELCPARKVSNVHYFHEPKSATDLIGRARNRANAMAPWADVIVHLDDDDYSHPNRIAEQVALLQSTGADCVGYREMLFWRESYRVDSGMGRELSSIRHGQAFLYTNPDRAYCMGTSLCYWRRTWERNPFATRSGPNELKRGEDREFLRGIKSVGVNSMRHVHQVAGATYNDACEPRMIARIHTGNASNYPTPAEMETSHSWRRLPEWDAHCKSVMEDKWVTSI